MKLIRKLFPVASGKAFAKSEEDSNLVMKAFECCRAKNVRRIAILCILMKGAQWWHGDCFAIVIEGNE